MKKGLYSTTTVIDAGARYGIHPSWNNFKGDIMYYAFEPDKEEAQRLAKLNKDKNYHMIDKALAKETGERDFFITKHKGYCSLLELDQNNEWFKKYRPGEGKVVKKTKVKTISIDEFVTEKKTQLDFLKVDTEGTELEVLEGASNQLENSIMGIRCNVDFQPNFKGQALFSDIHNYLLKKGFFLLNLDYFGYGVPRNTLFRKPDPLSQENLRYGTIIGTDAVWLKDYDEKFEQTKTNSENAAYTTLKYSYFCLLNNAPDVGIDVLLDFIKNKKGKFSASVKKSKIYKSLKYAYAELLGRWRVCPDQQWKLIQRVFKDVFELELKQGSEYWELLEKLKK